MVEQNNITLGEMVNGLSVALSGGRTEPNQEEIILKMMVSGLMSGLNYPITCTCMRPSKATSNEVGQHLAVGKECNPFPNKPWFLHVCCTSPMKTLREKEKLLIMSNFYFSLSVFYLLEELSAIFIKFIIVICKPFQFGRV